MKAREKSEDRSRVITFECEPRNYPRLTASSLPRALVAENTLAEINDETIRTRENIGQKHAARVHCVPDRS
jgi:hypothetical protein